MIRKESYWMTDDGNKHEIPFQRHALAMAKLLGEKFNPDKVLTYYDKAFKKGMVRISIYGTELAFQLEKPASAEQIMSCLDIFRRFQNAQVTYRQIDGQISSEEELVLALDGKNPYS